MEIHWSPEAAADFTAMIQYIRQDNSPAALRVARTIYQAVAQLKVFPNRGRPGRVDVSLAALAEELAAADHLLGGAPGKGHQQDRAGIDALFDQMGDAIDQRAGLARAGAGFDEDIAYGQDGGLLGWR